MSGKSVYFITKAEDGEEASYDVDCWLDEHSGIEFYGRYKISLIDVKRVDEFDPGYFENALRECDKREANCREEIEKCKNEKDKIGEGYAHKRLGDIMMKSFCDDMPYWNLITDSWDLPEKDNWAVMVTLY
jgi:hypothetical protein